jgi:hypothetical protein
MSDSTSSRRINDSVTRKTLDFATLAAHLVGTALHPATILAHRRSAPYKGTAPMDLVRGIVIWGLVALGSATIAGVLAGIKNRDYSFWIAWCFIAPPLVFFLLLLPRHQGPRPRRPSLDEQERSGGW